MSKSKYRLTTFFLPRIDRERNSNNSDNSKVAQIIYSILLLIFVMDFQGMAKICLVMKQRIFYALNIDEIQGSVSDYI